MTTVYLPRGYFWDAISIAMKHKSVITAEIKGNLAVSFRGFRVLLKEGSESVLTSFISFSVLLLEKFLYIIIQEAHGGQYADKSYRSLLQ